MPSRDLPNLALKGFFDLGEDGWDDEISLNLLKLSVLVQATALDKVAADPGAPVDGDVYIFDETHPTQANKVAIRDAGAWVYVTPFEGWLIFNQAAGYYEKFDGAVWAELATGGGGGGISDAPSDGELYGRKDGNWEVVPGGAASSLVKTFSELRPVGSASGTSQASKGTRIAPQVDLEVSKVRLAFNALAGTQYKFAVWSLSGDNLDTLIIESATWTEPSTVSGVYRFLDLSFTLVAGGRYFMVLSALNRGDTYALPINATTNSTFYSNLPATEVDFGRLAKAVLVTGDTISFGTGGYAIDLWAEYDFTQP